MVSYLSNFCDHYLTRNNFRAEMLALMDFITVGKSQQQKWVPAIVVGMRSEQHRPRSRKRGMPIAQLPVSFSFLLLSPAYGKVASVFSPLLKHSVLSREAPTETKCASLSCFLVFAGWQLTLTALCQTVSSIPTPGLWNSIVSSSISWLQQVKRYEYLKKVVFKKYSYLYFISVRVPVYEYRVIG